MKEKAIIGFIGILTCLLIFITLFDVIWNNDSINKTSGESTTGKDVIEDVAENGGTEGTTGDGVGVEDSTDDGDDSNASENVPEGNLTIINPEGMSLASRISPPSGYTRTEEKTESL